MTAGSERIGVSYMIDGKFTKEEHTYFISLDALDELRARSLVYLKHFREECM